jgi:hypothetical protein
MDNDAIIISVATVIIVISFLFYFIKQLNSHKKLLLTHHMDNVNGSNSLHEYVHKKLNEIETNYTNRLKQYTIASNQLAESHEKSHNAAIEYNHNTLMQQIRDNHNEDVINLMVNRVVCMIKCDSILRLHIEHQVNTNNNIQHAQTNSYSMEEHLISELIWQYLTCKQILTELYKGESLPLPVLYRLGCYFPELTEEIIKNIPDNFTPSFYSQFRAPGYAVPKL